MPCLPNTAFPRELGTYYARKHEPRLYGVQPFDHIIGTAGIVLWWVLVRYGIPLGPRRKQVSNFMKVVYL